MYELTVYEYDDTQTIGQYATKNDALAALGLWLLNHPDAQLVYPHITEINDPPVWTQIRTHLNDVVRDLETYPTGGDPSTPSAYAIHCMKAQGVRDALAVIDDLL